MTAADRFLVYRITTSAADHYRAGLETFAEGMLHALSLVLIDHGASGDTVKCEGAIGAAAIAIGFGVLAGAKPSLRPAADFALAMTVEATVGRALAQRKGHRP